MKFRIGAITARCAACDGSEFEALDPEGSGAQAKYGCARCGRRTIYSALIVQIGDEAVKRSRETIDTIKKRRSRI